MAPEIKGYGKDYVEANGTRSQQILGAHLEGEASKEREPRR